MFWIIWDLAKWIMIGLQAPVVDEHDLELLRGLFLASLVPSYKTLDLLTYA